MKFLYPEFLYALSAIAIPVIIHLFNFRVYKTVYFSNISFLQNIKQESRAKSKVKHWLVLLSRILAIVALVLAFAQPYVPLADSVTDTGAEVVSVYVDNSFSMDAESTYGKLLEVAKNRARSIVDAYPASTDFMLITNDFEQKHHHKVKKEQFLEFLSEVDVTPTVRRMSEVYSRQQDILAGTENTEVKNSLFLLSDFQKSITDLEQLNNDSSINTHLIPLATQPTNNLYIDSCWFESPSRKLNNTENLYVQVVNTSEEDYQDIPVELFINDSLKAIGSVNIAAKNAETLVLTYTNTQTGILHGKVQLSDYPITYDNAFYFSYTIAENINILSINHGEPSRYIKALFANDDYFTLHNFSKNNIQPSQFPNFQLIILNEIQNISSGLAQSLNDYIKEGGNLLFFPNSEGDIESYNAFLKSLNTNYFTHLDTQQVAIKAIDYKHEIYTNVFRKIDNNADLPVIFSHFVLSQLTQTQQTNILSTQTGHTILAQTNYGRGKLYVSAIPLSTKYSNFAEHILFVPTLYNIALFSQNNSRIYYTIGKDNMIEINNREFEPSDYNVFHISKHDGSFDFIPQQNNDLYSASIKLFIQQNIEKAGNYIVTNNEQTITGVAFNYNRSESDLSYYSQDELQQLIGQNQLASFVVLQSDSELLTADLEELKKGRQYWKWLIILALLFFAFEIFLLRYWKKYKPLPKK